MNTPMCNGIARLAQQRSRCARRRALPKIAWKRFKPRVRIGGRCKWRERLDDAILTLRASETGFGLWIIKTAGNPDAVLAIDEFILNHQDNWFVREVLGMLRRTFARIDVTSRSIYAIVEPGSCYAGTLLELALAADRIYMRDTQEAGSIANMALSKMNFGPLRW